MPWWRYSRYEVHDGRICPRPKARLESYDPWIEYENGKRRAGEPPPYLSLLNLLDEIRPEVHLERRPWASEFWQKSPHLREQRFFETLPSPLFLPGGKYGQRVPGQRPWRVQPFLNAPTRPFRLAEMSERAIKRVLEWTEQHGLLGILPHRVLLLQTGPKRAYSQKILKGLYTRWSFTRMGGQHWWAQELMARSEAPLCVHFPRSAEPLAVIVPANQVLADFDLRNDSVPWHFDPHLGQRDFWGRYCEPLSEWFYEAESLSSMIRLFNGESLPWELFIPNLNLMFASAGHHLTLGPGGVRLDMHYPSLIAAFAVMYAQDLVDRKKRIVTCRECGTLAASSAYRRTYCSQRCAWRARKRRQREREVRIKERLGSTGGHKTK